MNSRFIIIAILIFVKVIGVASRAKADDYSSCYSVNKIKYIVQDEDFYNPVFRCGKTTVFKDV
tara:strand:- start:544 stop:732 length:189 start_codon:yes stop_codon:yes gene_type:complete